MFKIELKRRRLLPRVILPWFRKLPKIMLPQIDLPRVRIDFPEEEKLTVGEMEMEGVAYTAFTPKGFTIMFRAKLSEGTDGKVRAGEPG